MKYQEAMSGSRDGVAVLIDSKGQRWACWIDKENGFTGRLSHQDGREIPLTEATAGMLNSWIPKDPKDHTPKFTWPGSEAEARQGDLK